MAVVEEVQPPARPWPAVLAPLALAVGFFGALLGDVVVSVVAAAAGASLSHPPKVVGLISTVIQDAAFVVAPVLLAAQYARPRAAEFGLRPTALKRAVLAVILGGVAFYVFAGAWISALKISDKEKLLDQLGANENAVSLVAVCLLTCVIAPICEEFFFRGFFFTALRSRLGPWLAATITGVVFGAIHGASAPIGYLVPLAFFGFVLCVIYWKTQSLYPCIALHALNNAIAVGQTEHWNWQIPVLVVAALATIAVTLRSVARLAPAQ